MADSVATLMAGMNLKGTQCILHLGAGRGDSVAAALSCGARHIALVEPEPELSEGLMQRVLTDPRLHLHPVAVGPDDGAALLNVFNMRACSSLRPPGDLMILQPGLRCVTRVAVDVVTLDALTRRLPPASDDDHDLLIVDCTGAEGSVIDALLAASPDPNGPIRFDRLILCCGTTETYEGSAAFDALLERLRAAGWVGDAVDATDPDRPGVALQRDRPTVTPTAEPVPDHVALIEDLTAAGDRAQNRAALAEKEVKTARDLHAILQTDLAELQQLLAVERERNDQLESLLRQALPHLRAALAAGSRPARSVKSA